MAAPPPPPAAPPTKGIDLSKVLLDYKKGSRVYFTDDEDGWAMAQAEEDPQTDTGSLKIRYRMVETGEMRDFKIALSALNSTSLLPPLKNPGFMDTVDDLSLLSYLHEPGVFWGIKNRFAAQKIYTYSGMVLIAVNPFERLNIYSTDIMREYAGSKRTDLEPHVYGIAEECYRAMLEGHNQSVIVSGESGAGKTQSTRYIMQYLAVVDSLSKIDSVEALMRPESMNAEVKRSETEEAVLASNPILESFGNAKTTRNDNSSRFGKFVELFFSNPSSGSVRITGAKVRTYLLERSRLIFQPKTERNYHIFYQLCAAVPAAERKHLALDRWETFHYLNQGNAGVVRNMNDVEEYKLTMDALSTLGMSVSTQWEIFGICAAVLHIGNVKILTSGNDGSSIAENDPAVENCARLLGINKSDFIKWVTKKQTTVGREKYVKDLKSDLALVARDSVTKVIYTKLFDWLVKNINKSLKRDSTNDQNFIGVLDIYGFEHFAVNSFEQFCINYANEKLQQEFNSHVFRLEQEGYIKEAIDWEMIEFSDNQGCIELIEGRMGIMALLDEDSRLPAGTDATFVGKLLKNFDVPTQKFFAKPRFGTTDFTVRHYAVDVTYTSTGFIDKNKDSMSDELKDVLLASTNSFFKDVFLGIGTGGGEGVESPKSNGGTIDRRRSTMARVPTLGSMFKASLAELMDTIRATESHYIRCIKPNMAKTSFAFEGAMVLSQLKACGVLETIKISNAGYPNKLEYDQFASRYEILVSSSFWDMPDRKALCIKIVTTVLSDQSKYQFGKTKVFLKSGQIAFFENRRKDRINYLILLAQKNMKKFLQRTRYLRIKEAAVVLQSAARGHLAYKHYVEMREEKAAVKLQTAIRGYLCRKHYQAQVRSRSAALTIQRCWRGHVARKACTIARDRVILIQSCVRKSQARKAFKTLRLQAKDLNKVKEKTFGLESKVLSLSKALQEKSSESKDWSEKCATFESMAHSLKEKLEASEAKFKASATELFTLRKQVQDLQHERDVLRAEKERYAFVVDQAASEGLISPIENIPIILKPDGTTSRGVSMSRNGNLSSGARFTHSPSGSREPSVNREMKRPIQRLNSVAVGGADSGNAWPRGGNLLTPEVSRGRTVSELFPQMRSSVSPSGIASGSSGTGAPNMPLPGKPGPMGRLGSISANPNGEDSIIASLRAENENLKKIIASKGGAGGPPGPAGPGTGPRAVPVPVRRTTMRSQSIFAGDILGDAERERQKELHKPAPTPVPTSSDLKKFLLTTPLGGNMLSASPGAIPSLMASPSALPSDMRTSPTPMPAILRAAPPSPMKNIAPGMLLPPSTLAPLVAEPEEDYPSRSSTPTFLPRRSSIKQNVKLQQDRAELFASEEFNDVICDELILNLQVPPITSRRDASPRSQQEVFYPAHLLGSIISMQLEVGMLVELHGFVNDIMNAVCKVVIDNRDKSSMTFWISNIHQLLCITALIHSQEVKKPNNRGNLNGIRNIQNDLHDLLENELVPILLKRLREEVASLAAPAILQTQELPGFETSHDSTFWDMFGRVMERKPEGPSDLYKLKLLLTTIDNTLCAFYVPDALYSKTMMEMMRTIGVVSFNGLLRRRNLANFKRGCQIQYNLKQMEEWCAKVGLSSALAHLEMVAQAAKILTLNKTEAEDVTAVFEIGYLLNANQINQLFSNYSITDPDMPMSIEFQSLIRDRAAVTNHRDVVSISLDPEPQYPLMTITSVHHIDKSVPASVRIPPDYQRILA
ncbi:Myosin type-2 heavy chain 1 [Chytriomyces hyalinus]|nr:Myosin type-2 heavy chain 1 [Chytriomyces hyalinus]